MKHFIQRQALTQAETFILQTTLKNKNGKTVVCWGTDINEKVGPTDTIVASSFIEQRKQQMYKHLAKYVGFLFSILLVMTMTAKVVSFYTSSIEWFLAIGVLAMTGASYFMYRMVRCVRGYHYDLYVREWVKWVVVQPFPVSRQQSQHFLGTLLSVRS